MVSISGNRRMEGASVFLLVTLVVLQGNPMAVLIMLALDPTYRHYASEASLTSRLQGC